MHTTTTKHKIGQTTYLVTAAQGDNANEPLHRKLERCIQRQVRRIYENA